jgi:RNA polymerase sigma factor (sigma-70 family)
MDANESARPMPKPAEKLLTSRAHILVITGAKGAHRMTTALGVLRQPMAITNRSKAGEIDRYDDDGLSVFLSVRSRLFGIAYRMLGSAAEAEDVLQDVWIRWQTADRVVVREPAAFLVTTTTRLAINVMQSARSRRETSVRALLPEPVATCADPGSEAERQQALGWGVLLLLQTLSPTERAAYILREAFDYSYRQIAHALQLGEANVRQAVTRARQHVVNGRRASVTPSDRRRLLEAFIAAAASGHLSGLERMLRAGCRRSSRRRLSSNGGTAAAGGSAGACEGVAA